MKHSIFVKFLAVLLCAGMLMTALGSGAAIILLKELGLYDQDTKALRQASVEGDLNSCMSYQAQVYFAQAMGNFPEEAVKNEIGTDLWDSRYSPFRNGKLYAEVKDGQGNVLTTFGQLEDTAGAERWEIPLTGQKYLYSLGTVPEITYEFREKGREEQTSEDYGEYVNNLGAMPTDVYSWRIFGPEGEEISRFSGSGILGQALILDDGRLRFDVFQESLLFEGESYGLELSDEDGDVIFSLCDPGYSVGHWVYQGGAYAFETWHSLASYEATQNLPVASDASVVSYLDIPEEGCVPFAYELLSKDHTAFHSAFGDQAQLVVTEGGRLRLTSGTRVSPESERLVYGIQAWDEDGDVLVGVYQNEPIGTWWETGEGCIFLSTFLVSNGQIIWELEEAETENAAVTAAVLDDFIWEIDLTEGQGEAYQYTLFGPEGNPTMSGGGTEPGVAALDEEGHLTYSQAVGGLENTYDDVCGIQLKDAQGVDIVYILQPYPIGTWQESPTGSRFVSDFRILPDGTVAWPDAPLGADLTEIQEKADMRLSGAAETAAAEPIPVESLPQTQPETPEETTEQTTAETYPAVDPALLDGIPQEEYGVMHTRYWDGDRDAWMVVEYLRLPIPEGVTAEVYLAPGAYRYDGTYALLEMLRDHRNDYFLMAAISALLFAACGVYLCCAAGRKRGREEVRAGGLNRLPLDVYFGLTGLALTGLTVLGVNGTQYMLETDVATACGVGLGAAYLFCVIFVGFLFACVAQGKTPGGYWWRNTLTVRLCSLGWRVLVWTERFTVRKGLPWCVRWVGKLWNIGWHLVKTSWDWLLEKAVRLVKWLWKWLHKTLSLLPMAWQWLLGGLAVMFLIVLGMNANGLGLLTCLSMACAILCYSALCFGVLLRGAKRMSQGDLDVNIHDPLMVGCFKEFAGDLNALADVVVVAAQKQLKSERMKTELITNVSHDIKTPLTSIINYVDLLQKPHTEEEQKAYLEVLARQSQRLKKLIDDLMEMSKASTGNMTTDITRLDGVEAVNQALGEFADKLAAARLTPLFRHDQETAPMMADGRLVWRVLSNLLSNTVKYALPGTRLYIDLMTLDGKVVISLKNISRDPLNVDAEELMERFVRGDDSRNTEGSGLGLNIAKSLMELQKGQLQLLVDGDLFKVTLTFPGVE